MVAGALVCEAGDGGEAGTRADMGANPFYTMLRPGTAPRVARTSDCRRGSGCLEPGLGTGNFG